MADTEKIRIVVEAEDNASQILSNIGKGIGGLNTALRQYNSMMSSFNNMMINGVEKMGSAIYDFTSDSISNFSELSEQHAKTLGAMANDYDKTVESQQKFMENSEKLKQQAIDLAKYGINGRGSLATSTEVSAMQTELVKAGVSADTMLSTNVVSDVLQFAHANQLDTASAVEFAVSLGSQFGIGYENWGEMLDKVSHTADMSIIDVADIVQSMKYAGGITSGLDRPLEETLGMISILGNFGLRGSQAGSGIQALFTRLLTGDTTVITDAMAEVAPPKALEAFYNFSNYAKSAGSEITYDDILNETFTETDITGQLRPMDEVIDTMEQVMSELTDEEQAWFAKKLFGLYQMKSAYALINGDDSADMALGDVIAEIEQNSLGTNANKLEELINSQSGQIDVTANMIEGIKTELGQMLEPTTLALLHEVQELLKDPGNYNIDWNSIRMALDESCDAIEEAYGTAISDAVRNLGNLTIDLGMIVEEIAPELLEGLLDVFNSAIDGDFFGKDGVSGDWSSMITNMREALRDLPPDLQELGDKVVSVIDMFGKLAALNIATTVAQLVTSVLQIALMTVTAASVIVNGNSVGGGTGTATAAGAGTAAGTATAAGAGTTATISSASWGVTGAPYIISTLAKGAMYAYLANTGINMMDSTLDTKDYMDMTSDARKSGLESLLSGASGSKLSGLNIKNTGGLFPSWGMLDSSKTYDQLNKVQREDLFKQMSDGTYTSSSVMHSVLAKLIGYDDYENIKMIPDEAGRQHYRLPDGSMMLVSDGWNLGMMDPFSSTQEALEPQAQYILGLVEGYISLTNARAKNSSEFVTNEEAQELTQLLMDVSANMLESGYRQNNDGTFGKEELAQIISDILNGSASIEDYYDKSEQTGDVSDVLPKAGIASILDGNDSTTVASSAPDSNYWANVIPGFYAYSNEGQQDAIRRYMMESQMSLSPSFTMEAPQIQVDITIDGDGNVISQKQAILNPLFSRNMNTWYQRAASQNGSTTK